MVWKFSTLSNIVNIPYFDFSYNLEHFETHLFLTHFWPMKNRVKLIQMHEIDANFLRKFFFIYINFWFSELKLCWVWNEVRLAKYKLFLYKDYFWHFCHLHIHNILTKSSKFMILMCNITTHPYITLKKGAAVFINTI